MKQVYIITVYRDSDRDVCMETIGICSSFEEAKKEVTKIWYVQFKTGMELAMDAESERQWYNFLSEMTGRDVQSCRAVDCLTATSNEDFVKADMLLHDEAFKQCTKSINKNVQMKNKELDWKLPYWTDFEDWRVCIAVCKPGEWELLHKQREEHIKQDEEVLLATNPYAQFVKERYEKGENITWEDLNALIEGE